MLKIKAVENTYLKKYDNNGNIVDANKLPDSKKTYVPKNKIYEVEKHTLIDGDHDWITLAHNSGSWLIYEPHWKLDYERPEEKGDYEPIGIKNTIKVDLSDPNLWYNNRNKISNYFTVGEVTQYDIRRIPVRGSKEEQNIFKLAKELDKLRVKFGPITITSWYRPPAINKSIGGATFSQHIYGLAADIRPAHGNVYTLRDIQAYCLSHWKGGVGKGLPKGFLHLDARNGFPCFNAGKPTAIWNY